MRKSEPGYSSRIRGLPVRPRKNRPGLPALLVFILAGAAALGFAQETSVDILHYRLDIRPDFTRQDITLIADITLVDPDREGEFAFGLNDSLRNVRVAAPSSPLTFEREEGWITVKVRRPTKRVQLHFEINGSLGKGDAGREAVTASDLFLLWSDRFYPIAFGDWAKVTTVITLPAAFKVIAPGRLMGTQRKAEEVEWTFETSRPAVCYSLAVATLEEGSGQRLQTWCEEWLERKGIPEIAWKADIRKAGAVYSVVCEVEQLGALYHLPLEIGIETARGLRVERVDLEAKAATFTLASAEEPRRVLLDPRGWILMKQTPR